MATSTQEWIEELKGISVLSSPSGSRRSRRSSACPPPRSPLRPRAARGGGDGGGRGGGGAAPFDVFLTGSGDKKIQVIKVVRAATVSVWKRRRRSADESPQPVKEGIDREEADKLKRISEEAGGYGRGQVARVHRDAVLERPRRRGALFIQR